MTMCINNRRDVRTASQLRSTVIVINGDFMSYFFVIQYQCSYHILFSMYWPLIVPLSMFQGFRKVYNISGGIHAYAVKVDPSVPTYWFTWFCHFPLLACEHFSLHEIKILREECIQYCSRSHSLEISTFTWEARHAMFTNNTKGNSRSRCLT